MKNFDIKAFRTGRNFSFSSNEFLIIFPNGDKTCIWSPPWHEMESGEELKQAIIHAKSIYEKSIYEPWDKQKAISEWQSDIDFLDENGQNDNEILKTLINEYFR